MNETLSLSDIVTSDMINGVFNEIYGLLPVLMPAMVGFLAVRKGISFVQGVLRAA